MVMACTLLCFGAQARAAARTFVVLPFAVSGSSSLSYLEDAIPSMLTSRLSHKGQTQAVPLAEKAKPIPVADDKTAKAIMGKAGADYVIWGAVAAQGDNAAVDMRLIGQDGKQWKRTLKSSLGGLIVALQRGADAINTEVFGIGQSGQTGSVGRRATNPAFVSNESTQRQVYLNPQFRYEGADQARTRSQSLNFAAVSMVVADVMGDGKNSVVILDDHKVVVFAWEAERMKQLGLYELPKTDYALSIHAVDLDGDKAAELVVNMLDREQSLPFGYILSFKGGQFRELARRVPFYMNVVKLPPDFQPTLIGQRGDSNLIFANTGVRELALNGNTVAGGRRLTLPSEANVLNFTWIPGGAKTGGPKLAVLTKDEQIRVYSEKLAVLSLTDARYSGSAQGIDSQRNMPGLGKDLSMIPEQYYVPMRMLPLDVEKRGDHTLLVNRPISVSAQFFARYRFYPEGEIQNLFWDGVGLSLLWKTRRIRGSVVDFTVADLANNGSLSLVVCINTHPGALGFSERKTVVLNYPLDLGQSDPNTPFSVEEE